MLPRLAFLLLLCALVMPRVAWAAHMVGHEELSATVAIHTHHDDHSHEHDEAHGAEQSATGDLSDIGSLTHDHGPSQALVAAVVMPDVAGLISTARGSKAVLFDRTLAFDPFQHPDSILRPPRLA